MIALLCISVLVFDYTVAYSADIDGSFNGVEWNDAVVTKLFEGESNSGVNFALVHSMIDSENSALFLCFMHKDPSLECDNTATGVSLSADGSAYFDVTVSDSVAYSDSSSHSFEGCVTVDENNGATTEIRIGFKYGLPKEIECSVRFIDSVGALSNVYDFTIVNNEYTETTEMVITQYGQEETEKEKTTAKAKTAKAKTTKSKTATTKKSSRKTTVKETEIITQKVTREKETRVRNTYVRRTRQAETEPETVTTAVVMPATVYYYEKEIIISQVYVTQTEVKTAEGTLRQTETTTQAVIPTTAFSSAENTTDNIGSFSLSEGAKKKAAVGVLAAISFTVIAAAATRSSKKKSDNEESLKSE